MRKLLIVVFAVAAAGCATYRFDNESYTSKEAALAAQKKRNDEMLSKIEPLQKPVAKTAKFVGINKDIAVERGTTGANMDIRGYIADGFRANLRTTYEMIVKRNIFEKIEYIDADGLEPAVEGDKAVIYYYFPDGKTGGYYFASSNVKKTPLNFDRGNPDFAGRAKYFLDSVEALAAIK